jgi:hypothetical protein
MGIAEFIIEANGRTGGAAHPTRAVFKVQWRSP